LNLTLLPPPSPGDTEENPYQDIWKLMFKEGTSKISAYSITMISPKPTENRGKLWSVTWVIVYLQTFNDSVILSYQIIPV
jgi:hypothetical protein